MSEQTRIIHGRADVDVRSMSELAPDVAMHAPGPDGEPVRVDAAAVVIDSEDKATRHLIPVDAPVATAVILGLIRAVDLAPEQRQAITRALLGGLVLPTGFTADGRLDPLHR